MKINSRPPNPTRAPGGAGGPSDTQPRNAFEVRDGPAAKALEKVSGRFSVRDLDKPERAEQAARESFAAMLKDQPVSGALPEEKRAALADFMASDPILQQKMLAYLRKTLA